MFFQPRNGSVLNYVQDCELLMCMQHILIERDSQDEQVTFPQVQENYSSIGRSMPTILQWGF
jgi:hypothetical protein